MGMINMAAAATLNTSSNEIREDLVALFKQGLRQIKQIQCKELVEVKRIKRTTIRVIKE